MLRSTYFSQNYASIICQGLYIPRSEYIAAKWSEVHSFSTDLYIVALQKINCYCDSIYSYWLYTSWFHMSE